MNDSAKDPVFSRALPHADVELDELLAEFYHGPVPSTQLADFHAADKIPEPYNQLLNHHEHMTVTVEAFHGESVDVHVHRSHQSGKWYCREILLHGQQSGKIVQYGIVRLDTTTIDDEVWSEIQSESIPLGRVLINHNVMREVQLCGLVSLTAGPCLSSLMKISIGTKLYGRTALIYCNGEPAIHLLEIVRT